MKRNSKIEDILFIQEINKDDLEKSVFSINRSGRKNVQGASCPWTRPWTRWTRPWTLYKFLKILTMILSSMINIYFNLVFF